MEKVSISYRKFNPNFHHLREAMKDDDIRFIFLYGGSSSAKSFSVAQAMLIECLSGGNNTLVFRKVGSSIADSIYKTFQEAVRSLGVYRLFSLRENKIICFNGSYITFKGLDDSEKIKGLESYKYVVCEELSEFKEEDFKQIKKRLRGRKGQKIISMFNPIEEECWIKKNVFDKEQLKEESNDLYGILRDNETKKILPKEFSMIARKWKNTERLLRNPRTGIEEVHAPDTVIMQSTYLNNFWVVGSPDGQYGFYDRQAVADFDKDRTRDYNYYRIYALGEWGKIKTGGEFLHAFDSGKHKKICPVTEGIPLHISVDNNVLPYISVSIWQHEELELRQVHEICAEDPFNTVTKAAELTRTWLEGIGYDDVVYLHGDASTRSGNTIDDEKRSFLDKFIDVLEETFRVVDMVPKKNPPVAMSGEFVNALLEGFQGISVSIDESCKKSIQDYENVKKDTNGGILKARIKDKITKQSYEEFGHLTDCFRYVCTDIFREQFLSYSMARKRNTHKKENMKYYNVGIAIEGDSIVYIMPDCNGKFIMIHAIYGTEVFIDGVLFRDGFDAGLMEEKLKEWLPVSTVFESHKSYFQFARDVREWMDNVRATSLYANMDQRISANEEFIKERFKFRSDYDDYPEYLSFMDSVMDYNGKENYEGINCLSALASVVARTIRNNQ